MINYDDVIKENINKHNLNWPQIPDGPYRTLTIRRPEPGKTNALLSLKKQQDDDDDYSIIDKIYLYLKDPYEAIYINILLGSVKKMVLKI